jgi:hypothetical protein
MIRLRLKIGGVRGMNEGREGIVEGMVWEGMAREEEV